MSIAQVKIFFEQLYNTSRNVLLFRINSVLNSLSVITESETINNLRLMYGNWYNKQLMKRFVDCDYYLKTKHISVSVENMVTIDNIVIVEIFHRGMTGSEVEEYLATVIGNWIPGSQSNIQVSNLDTHHAKVVFPL